VFNFSGSEVVFFLILGLVVLGPEKLPGVLRRVGRLYGEFRRVTSDAQVEMRKAFAEPIREVQEAVSTYKSEFEAGARAATDELRADPPSPRDSATADPQLGATDHEPVADPSDDGGTEHVERPH